MLFDLSLWFGINSPRRHSVTTRHWAGERLEAYRALFHRERAHEFWPAHCLLVSDIGDSVLPEYMPHIHAGQLFTDATRARWLCLRVWIVDLAAHKIFIINSAEKDDDHIRNICELPSESAATVAAEASEAAFTGLVLLVARCLGDVAELMRLQDQIVRYQGSRKLATYVALAGT
jgi:hypothetical protein